MIYCDAISYMYIICIWWKLSYLEAWNDMYLGKLNKEKKNKINKIGKYN